MIAKKATSIPLNPKCRTKEGNIGYKNNTLCFWSREKNQEALMCFLGVWKREKTRREAGQREKFKKMCSLLV